MAVEIIPIRSSIAGANVKTQEQFTAIWRKNFHQNKLLMRGKDTTVQSLLSLLQRRHKSLEDAWFFAAGASVEDHIDKWKRYNRGEAVFACDAVYRNLVLNGIIPDVVVTIDGQEKVYEFFRGVEIKPRTRLACTVFANPHVVQMFEDRQHFFHLRDPDTPIYEEFYGRYRHSAALAALGNVGNLNLLIGTILGVKRLWCIGYDYSLVNRRPYCKNVWQPGWMPKVKKDDLVRSEDRKHWTTKPLAMCLQAAWDVWKTPEVPSQLYNVTGQGTLGIKGGPPKIHMSSWREYQRLALEKDLRVLPSKVPIGV